MKIKKKWFISNRSFSTGTTRVAGNKKGILTRSRQPKRIAYVIRDRYRQIPSLNLEAGSKRFDFEFLNEDDKRDYEYWSNRDNDEYGEDKYYDNVNVIDV